MDHSDRFVRILVHTHHHADTAGGVVDARRGDASLGEGVENLGLKIGELIEAVCDYGHDVFLLEVSYSVCPTGSHDDVLELCEVFDESPSYHHAHLVHHCRGAGDAYTR